MRSCGVRFLSNAAEPVNFFGHAAVALECGYTDPQWVLGSMLPDFGSIIGARIESVSAPTLAAGVAFHHSVDAAFHDCEDFRSLSSASFAWLESRGVNRGSARALAHVGVELLLDRTLAHSEHYRTGYMGAFAASEHVETIAWVDLARAAVEGAERTSAHARLSELLQRLQAFGVDLHVCPLSLIATRLERILARRPRLALSAQDATHVLEWLTEFESRAERAVPGVLTAVERVVANKERH
jgi:hypothetical protein